jgi:hypothetical protein
VRLVAGRAGSTTCEAPITDGMLVMSRLTLRALRTNTPIDIDVAFDDPLRSDES